MFEELKGKQVLVTGNQGYIGPVLTEMLKASGCRVTGLDVLYFGKECELTGQTSPDRQIIKDIRDIEPSDFEGVDTVIHLAGLSNDPLGEFNPDITMDINYGGTMRTAECAREAGVGRMVYASSQSMYGISNTSDELDEDESEKNPITAYAKAKWKAECELKNIADPEFTTTFFRPSTVFGKSPKLRSDIVFNNLVGCAFTTGNIEIKSDGTPWRPVVHVTDTCRAFMAGASAPAELVADRAFNIGIENGNYTVRELAEAAGKAVAGSDVVFTNEHGLDSRSYRVGFSRILTELRHWYQPEWNLDFGAKELVEFFTQVGFTEEQFRNETCVRLSMLKKLIEDGKIDENLRMRGE